MSLILEALRKSEAERRRGSAPDVAMELPPATIARARATPAWLLPTTMFVVVALLAAWWWWWRRDPPPVMPPVTAPVTDATDSAAPAIVRRVQPQAAGTPATIPLRVAAPVIASPQPSPVAAQAPSPVQPQRAPPPVTPMPAPSQDVADIGDTAIPSVKLSMHMWDEAPSKRFVILNGQRMAEGDRNGELTVVAIERDGVVVERNGQRARVALP